MTPPRWKVGELARRTGMSVRALHHYDEIGLLEPTLRSPAGHRLYTVADVERLQQIQSLRLMGLALHEVKRLLDGAASSPRKVIDLHLARLHAQIAMQERLAERLTALARHLDAAETVSIDDLCRIIEAMTRMEKYFTSEQLDVLRQRREAVSLERAHQVQAQWAELIPTVRAAMAAGVDPGSAEISAIATRWKALVDEFTGQDPEIAAAVTRMYKEEGPALKEKLGEVPDQAMFQYISKAFAAMKA